MATIELTVLAAFHPLVFLVIILIFALLLVCLGPKVFRAIRCMVKQVGICWPGLARQHRLTRKHRSGGRRQAFRLRGDAQRRAG
jgi:hypothetical protein